MSFNWSTTVPASSYQLVGADGWRGEGDTIGGFPVLVMKTIAANGRVYKLCMLYAFPFKQGLCDWVSQQTWFYKQAHA